MSFIQKLWRIEILTITALLLVALSFGLYAEFFMHLGDHSEGHDFQSFRLVFVLTFLIGFLPATIYGAFLYTYYLTNTAFPMPALLLASSIPGFLILGIDELTAGFAIVAGPFVAILVDCFARIWRRPFSGHFNK